VDFKFFLKKNVFTILFNKIAGFDDLLRLKNKFFCRLIHTC